MDIDVETIKTTIIKLTKAEVFQIIANYMTENSPVDVEAFHLTADLDSDMDGFYFLEGIVAKVQEFS